MPTMADTRWARRVSAIDAPNSVFTVVLAAAAILIYVASSQGYFKGDEWAMFQDRSLTSLDGWLAPHNEVHWIPGPVVLYRVLYNLVGVDHYWLYHTPGIAMHLLAAWLVRQLMIDAHIDRWSATAAASLFALYGAGAGNLLWAFQVGFITSLAMGLVHLRLATHSGGRMSEPVESREITRRDALGLASGFVALAFGGVGVTMVVVVGLATALLRGWRVAAFHTVPLGVIYAAWWLGYVRGQEGERAYGTPRLWLEWIANGYRETFGTLGGWAPLGAVLAFSTILGLGVLWHELRVSAERWQRYVPVVSLAVGSVVVQQITALGRVAQPVGDVGLIVLGPEGGRSSRYIYLVAALILPIVALGVSALVRRWPPVAVAAVGVVAIGLVVNIGYLFSAEKAPAFDDEVQQSSRAFVSDVAYSPLINEVPGETLVPLDFVALRVDWLRSAVADGALPKLEATPPDRAADAEAALMARRVNVAGVCSQGIESGLPVTLEAGDVVMIIGNIGTQVSYRYTAASGVDSAPIRFTVFESNALEIGAPTATLTFEFDPATAGVALCDA